MESSMLRQTATRKGQGQKAGEIEALLGICLHALSARLLPNSQAGHLPSTPCLAPGLTSLHSEPLPNGVAGFRKFCMPLPLRTSIWGPW